MTDVVVFDIDGTLVDSNYHHALAWYDALARCGVTVPVWRVHRHIGMGGDQIVRALVGEEFERARGDDARAAHAEAFSAMLAGIRPIDGARDLLRGLRQGGLQVVVASSASASDVDSHLTALDAHDLVDACITAERVDRTKPDPDLVRAALDEVSRPAESAVMVGDAPWDIVAAARIGVPTVAVLTGGHPRADLEAAGAVAVVPSVAEVSAADLRTLFEPAHAS